MTDKIDVPDADDQKRQLLDAFEQQLGMPAQDWFAQEGFTEFEWAANPSGQIVLIADDTTFGLFADGVLGAIQPHAGTLTVATVRDGEWWLRDPQPASPPDQN